MSTVTAKLGMIKAEGSDIVNVVDHISNNLQIIDNTFAAHTPTTQAIGDAAVQGAAIVVARSDHKHGMPAFGTPVATGSAINNGSSANIARADHVHTVGVATVGPTALTGTPYFTATGTSASQSVANITAVSVVFDAEVLDSTNGHNNVTNNTKYFASVAGWYVMIGTVLWDSNTTGTRDLQLRINGASAAEYIGYGSLQGSAVASSRQQVVGMYFLNPADYVELVVIQFSGGTRTIDTTHSALHVARIGS